MFGNTLQLMHIKYKGVFEMEKEIRLSRDIMNEQLDLEENDTEGFCFGLPLGRKLGRRHSIQRPLMNGITENNLELFKSISIED